MKSSRRPTLVLSLLGSPSLRVRGRLVPPSRNRKPFELLAALCLRPGAEGDRSLLEGWLWPESPKEKAQACLRQTLRRLREMLGPEQDRVRTRGRSLAVDLRGALVDVLAFDNAVARATDETLGVALDLHRGPLLEGWDSEWIVEHRAPRFAAWLAALRRVAGMRIDRGEHAEALVILERLIQVEPLDETAVRALMDLHASMGRHTDAIRVYRAYRAGLNSEMRTEPSPATSALHARLCREARAAAEGNQRMRRPNGVAGRGVDLGARRVVLDGIATVGRLRFSTRVEIVVPAGVPATGWQVRLASRARRGDEQRRERASSSRATGLAGGPT